MFMIIFIAKTMWALMELLVTLLTGLVILGAVGIMLFGLFEKEGQ